MKNIILVSLFLLTFVPMGIGQITTCYTSGVSSQVTTPVEDLSCGTIEDSYDDSPIRTISVNIHWFANNEGENFDPVAGLANAQKILDACNAQLANMPVNEELGNTGLPIAHIPDAKWRLKLYSNPQQNPNDVHGGVFYHSFRPVNQSAGLDEIFFPDYGEQTISIYLTNDESFLTPGCPSCGVGSFAGYTFLNGSLLEMFNVAYFINDPGAVAFNARVMMHEIGHGLGLWHSWSCQDGCSDVVGDISPANECSAPACNPGAFYPTCTYNNGNNLMSSGDHHYAISPCQWNTMYNNLLKHPSAKIECNSIPALGISIENGQDITWSSVKYMNGTIRVKSGGKLTIKCTVYFTAAGRVVVDRGGQLVIDGGHLTRLCDDRWYGVEVWGNPALEQPTPGTAPLANQSGVVTLINGAKIDWANIGIYAGNRFYSHNVPVSSGNGGLIISDNAEFKNNLYGVCIPVYSSSNKSYFKNTSFKGNKIGAIIRNTDGISFDKCSFYAKDGSKSNITPQNIGLSVTDAYVMVKNNCLFSQLEAGIVAKGTYSYATKLQVMDNNKFTANKVGIYSSTTDFGVGLEVVGKNEFRNNQVGIVSIGSSRFNIEDNHFESNWRTAIHLIDTKNKEESPNLTVCNTFFLNECNDIYAQGDISNFVYDGNTHASSDRSFLLSGSESGPGTVGANMSGGQVGWVKNTYTFFTTHDIVTQGNTAPFVYWHSPTATSIEIPRCDQDDSNCATNYSFTNLPTLTQLDGSCTSPAYNQDIKDNFITEENFGTQSPIRKLGYLIKQGNYIQATTMLTQWNPLSVSEQLYKQVQLINVAKLANPEIVLSGSMVEGLKSVIDTKDPLAKPYAQNLIDILEDNIIKYEIPLCTPQKPEGRDRNDNSIFSDIRLFPIPAQNQLQITGLDRSETYILHLMTAQGKICKIQQFTGEEATLHLEDLPSGLYLAQIQNSGGVRIVKKVIIQH